MSPHTGPAVLHPGLESLSLVGRQRIAAAVVPDNYFELRELILIHDCAVFRHKVRPVPLVRDCRQCRVGSLNGSLFAKTLVLE